MSELTVPPEQSLAEEKRDEIEGLEELVLGDHVKQQVLIDAGDSEAIARRLSQQTQASATYPAEETDAENIVADTDPVELDTQLIKEREDAEKARVEEIEREGEESAKAAKEAAKTSKGKTTAQQTMDAHQKATGEKP